VLEPDPFVEGLWRDELQRQAGHLELVDAEWTDPLLEDLARARRFDPS